jgi:hypothetical protein
VNSTRRKVKRWLSTHRGERIVESSERDYQTLEATPVDGTEEPEAENPPEPINIVSDEIEVATEEDLRRVIEEEGKFREPEIPAPSPDEAGARHAFVHR